MFEKVKEHCASKAIAKCRIMPCIAALRVEGVGVRDYETAFRLSQAEQELCTYFQTECTTISVNSSCRA
jgi:hypothetical protein